MKYFVYGLCIGLLCLIVFAFLTETKLGQKVLFFFHDKLARRRDE